MCLGQYLVHGQHSINVSCYSFESRNVSLVKNAGMGVRSSGPQEHPVSFTDEPRDLEQATSFL